MSDRNVAEESEDVDQGGGEETSNSERPDAELDPVEGLTFSRFHKLVIQNTAGLSLQHHL